jgi:hypothetical protein
LRKEIINIIIKILDDGSRQSDYERAFEYIKPFAKGIGLKKINDIEI